MPSQNDMGRAFEFSLALGMSNRLPAPVFEDQHYLTAQRCFAVMPATERRNMTDASREAVAFIVAHDDRCSDRHCTIALQADQEGMHGDVRDIIIHNSRLSQDIGISAKNRHWAVKHSRLSETIDFGSEWLQIRCSDTYFNQVTPLFRELRSRQRRHENWRDIPDKKQRYYMPILQAFQDEIQRLFHAQPNEVARRLVKYLLGEFDYYKVIKENGDVSIMSFNLDGTLKWGSRIPLPTRIIEISRKPSSQTTIIMTFDQGWQISFRIHNASTEAEPSLKFDINIIGLPMTMSRQVISYHG